MANSTDIGQKIKELRESRGMPKSELARRSGTTRNTLYRIESGRTAPSAAMLEQIARGLDVDPGDLYPKARRRSSLRPPVFPEPPDREERQRFAEEIKSLDVEALLEVGAALDEEIAELQTERAREGKTPFDFDPRLDTLLAKRMIVILQRHVLLRPGDKGRIKARDRQVAELVGAGANS